jgi:hypothetical protein
MDFSLFQISSLTAHDTKRQVFATPISVNGFRRAKLDSKGMNPAADVVAFRRTLPHESCRQVLVACGVFCLSSHSSLTVDSFDNWPYFGCLFHLCWGTTPIYSVFNNFPYRVYLMYLYLIWASTRNIVKT